MNVLCKIFVSIIAFICICDCAHVVDKGIFSIDRKGVEINFEKAELVKFVSDIKKSGPDSLTNILRGDPISPVDWMTFQVSHSDSIRLQLYSFITTEVIEYNNFLPEGFYFLDFNNMKLPESRYLLKFTSPNDTATTKFWVWPLSNR